MNNILEFIGLTTWQSGMMFGILFLFFIILFFIFFKYGQTKAIIFGFIFGILIGGVYATISSLDSYNSNATTEINQWFALTSQIFIYMILMIIPIYLFSIITTTLNSERHASSSSKVVFLSFSSLWLMSLIGILIAIILTPLIKLIQIPSSNSDIFGNISDTTQQTLPGIIGSLLPTSVAIFVNPTSIISIVFIALFMSLILNKMHNKEHNIGESIISFLEVFKKGILAYLKAISLMIPFVVMSRLPILFNNDNNQLVETTISLGLFIGVFFLGLSIVYLIEVIIIYFLSKNRKSYFNNLMKFTGNSIVYHSAPILLPKTIEFTKHLSNGEAINETTPSLGTFMGMSMCGGFYPALIAIMSASELGVDLNITFYVLLIFITLFASLGMTGIPGADVAVILSVLSGLGLSPTYFATVYIFDGILDKFRGIGNALGFVAATIITNSIIKEDNKQETKEVDN